MYEVVRDRNSLPGEPDWVGLVGPYFHSTRLKSTLRKAMPGHKGPLWEENSFHWVGLTVKAPGNWHFVVGDSETTIGVIRLKPASALHAAKAMASLLLDNEAKRIDPAYPTFWKNFMKLRLGRQVTEEEILSIGHLVLLDKYRYYLVTNPM
jgi:hypothetical protein